MKNSRRHQRPRAHSRQIMGMAGLATLATAGLLIPSAPAAIGDTASPSAPAAIGDTASPSAPAAIGDTASPSAPAAIGDTASSSPSSDAGLQGDAEIEAIVPPADKNYLTQQSGGTGVQYLEAPLLVNTTQWNFYSTTGTSKFTTSREMKTGYIIVGGGGGGGGVQRSSGYAGGGGGGGQVVLADEQTLDGLVLYPTDTYTVTVGAGGAGGAKTGGQGGYGNLSSLSSNSHGTIPAEGGTGGGGGIAATALRNGGDAFGFENTGGGGGNGTGGFWLDGFGGGNGAGSSATFSATGGGGGAGAIDAGDPGTSAGVDGHGGNGGVGETSYLQGLTQPLYLGGGGGGGAYTSYPVGTATHGGGAGGAGANGGATSPNTGGGGGGAGVSQNLGEDMVGGTGAAGAVMVRFLTYPNNPSAARNASLPGGSSVFTWDPPAYFPGTTTLTSYTVVYRVRGTLPWIAYARSTRGTPETLNIRKTKAACDSDNNVVGNPPDWTCVLGIGGGADLVTSTIYQFAVYARTAQPQLGQIFPGDVYNWRAP